MAGTATRPGRAPKPLLRPRARARLRRVPESLLPRVQNHRQVCAGVVTENAVQRWFAAAEPSLAAELGIIENEAAILSEHARDIRLGIWDVTGQTMSARESLEFDGSR